MEAAQALAAAYADAFAGGKTDLLSQLKVNIKTHKLKTDE